MVKQRQILPGFAVPLCIARTLAERDPEFLRTLRSIVAETMATQPRDGATFETLSIFLAAIDDPKLFPPLRPTARKGGAMVQTRLVIRRTKA